MALGPRKETLSLNESTPVTLAYKHEDKCAKCRGMQVALMSEHPKTRSKRWQVFKCIEGSAPACTTGHIIVLHQATFPRGPFGACVPACGLIYCISKEDALCIKHMRVGHILQNKGLNLCFQLFPDLSPSCHSDVLPCLTKSMLCIETCQIIYLAR
eukprot:1155857-Pelagomonas_calceolata.AAC.12